MTGQTASAVVKADAVGGERRDLVVDPLFLEHTGREQTAHWITSLSHDAAPDGVGVIAHPKRDTQSITTFNKPRAVESFVFAHGNAVVSYVVRHGVFSFFGCASHM